MNHIICTCECREKCKSVRPIWIDGYIFFFASDICESLSIDFDVAKNHLVDGVDFFPITESLFIKIKDIIFVESKINVGDILLSISGFFGICFISGDSDFRIFVQKYLLNNTMCRETEKTSGDKDF